MKVVAISDNALGAATAAPTPWITRLVSSQAGFWARPPTREATVNTATPMMKTLRRPYMSPSLPPNSSRPPKATA